MNDYNYTDSLPSRVTALEEEVARLQKQNDALASWLKCATEAQASLLKLYESLKGDGK